jgi:hypothetical protein
MTADGAFSSNSGGTPITNPYLASPQKQPCQRAPARPIRHRLSDDPSARASHLSPVGPPVALPAVVSEACSVSPDGALGEQPEVVVFALKRWASLLRCSPWISPRLAGPGGHPRDPDRPSKCHRSAGCGEKLICVIEMHRLLPPQPCLTKYRTISRV